MTEQEANLRQLAREYWTIRAAHERTADPERRAELASARSVAHEQLMRAMNDAGIAYDNREHAAHLARAWVDEGA